jgi:hypothetical protein
MRVLPHVVAGFSPLSPSTCMYACSLQGYKYAGVQWGWECWCGNEFPSEEHKIDNLRCDSVCVSSWEEKLQEAEMKDRKIREGSFDPQRTFGCGGDLTSSIYSTILPLLSPSSEAQQTVVESSPLAEKNTVDNDADTRLHFTSLTRKPKRATILLTPTQDLEFIVSSPGQSCSDACEIAHYSCDDALLASIHRDCGKLQELLGCNECVEPESPWEGFAAPGQERGNFTFQIPVDRVTQHDRRLLQEEVADAIIPDDHHLLAPKVVNAPAGWGPDLTLKKVKRKKKNKSSSDAPAIPNAADELKVRNPGVVQEAPLPGQNNQAPAEVIQKSPEKPATPAVELAADNADLKSPLQKQVQADETPIQENVEKSEKNVEVPLTNDEQIDKIVQSTELKDEFPTPLAQVKTEDVAIQANANKIENVVSPIQLKSSGTTKPCTLTRGKYLRCDAVSPSPTYVRACACVRSSVSTEAD